MCRIQRCDPPLHTLSEQSLLKKTAQGGQPALSSADKFKWVRKHVRLQYLGKHSVKRERSRMGRKGKLSADSRGAQIRDQMTAANPFVHYRMDLSMQIVSMMETVRYSSISKIRLSFFTLHMPMFEENYKLAKCHYGYDGNGIAMVPPWARSLSSVYSQAGNFVCCYSSRKSLRNTFVVFGSVVF